MTETMDLEEFRREARSWVQDNLERRVGDSARTSSEDKSPEEIAASRVLQRKLFDAGFAGISYPKEYGGRGLTPAHDRVWREETIDYVTPDFGGAGHVMFGAIGRSLLAHCTPEFLERRIPKLLAGEELWCQFYSEPEAGSDLAGIRTRATRDGDQWILNGAKIWSTGAHHADWAMCLARTDWDVPKHTGLTWFAVPTDAKGLTIRPIVQINGATGFCEEFLDDVAVSDDDVIGEVNQGWTVTRRCSSTNVEPGRAGGRTSPETSRPISWRSLAGRAAPTIPSSGRRSPEPTSTTSRSSTWVGASSPAWPSPTSRTQPSRPTGSSRRGRWHPSERTSGSRSPAPGT